MGFEIIKYKFAEPFQEIKDMRQNLHLHPMGENWPVVYIIYGDEEVYVGETSNALKRMQQHIKNPARNNLSKLEIIFDPQYNKSAILDIEQTLISMFHFEIYEANKNKRSKSFKKLQNLNGGQSNRHNYYQRAHYQDKVKDIWTKLQSEGLAKNAYDDIANDEIFKFSPYKTLSEDQKQISLIVLNKVMDVLEASKKGKATPRYTAFINGSAGSGKTIIILHMMSQIFDAIKSNQTNFNIDESFDDEDLDDLTEHMELINRVKSYYNNYGKPKIAYVAQMTALRKTIKRVFVNIKNFHAKDAIGPGYVASNYKKTNQQFDILFIDEAHRLNRRNAIQAMGVFDNHCRSLFGEDVDPNEYTTLDWLLHCSKCQVMVYDPLQTVKKSDILPDQFKTAFNRVPGITQEFQLKSQFRCRAGEPYIEFIDKFFSGGVCFSPKYEDYDLRTFEDPNELISEICKLDKVHGLCKVVTGYGWQWVTNSYKACEIKYQEAVRKGECKGSRNSRVDFYLNNLKTEDGLIEFKGKKYVRNLDVDWLLKGSPREIGCVHTSQGYDLNYVGILFGPEVYYDNANNRICIYPDKIKDSGGKDKSDTEISIQYTINAYKVMMTRGILGCFIYAHDELLREYLEKIFKTDDNL